MLSNNKSLKTLLVETYGFEQKIINKKSKSIYNNYHVKKNNNTKLYYVEKSGFQLILEKKFIFDDKICVKPDVAILKFKNNICYIYIIDNKVKCNKYYFLSNLKQCVSLKLQYKEILKKLKILNSEYDDIKLSYSFCISNNILEKLSKRKNNECKNYLSSNIKKNIKNFNCDDENYYNNIFKWMEIKHILE